ncbi:MAG: FABP family protein [Actinobacteria bacterium]|nr:FABP family protein [Actinomycetota bacterium]
MEVLIARHAGLVEVYLGEVAFSKIELATDLVARTATAKEVGSLKRLYGKVEDDLAYAIDMAAVGQPLQSHISARLQKVR